MADNLQLRKVVAFGTDGQPVLTPLNKWKLSYSERNASLKIQCSGYAKQYDLRTDLAAVAPGESQQKVAVGKTLGRLALTGLLHGRHAAGADLRWGGVDRDESVSLYLIFKDTTMVSMELESDEVEDLLQEIPGDVATEEAYQAALALHKRVKAMVQDGQRVLTELDATETDLNSQIATLQPLTESAPSFDERADARARCSQAEKQLDQLNCTRRAVVYELSASGVITGQVLSSLSPPTAVAPQAMNAATATQTAPAPIIAQPTPTRASPVARPPNRNKKSASKIVKGLAALVGVFVGLVASMLFAVFLSGMPVVAILQIPVMVVGGGWIAVKMLNALMAR